MKWYYAKKGDIERRGLVDDKTLHQMGRAREIDKDDLLWDDTDNNTWIRASSIEGLIPDRKPVALKKPPAAQEPIGKVPANFGRGKKKKKKSPVKLIILILGLIGLLILAWKADQFKKKQEAEKGKSSPTETLSDKKTGGSKDTND